LPRCGVFLLRDAVRFDLTIDNELLRAEQRVSAQQRGEPTAADDERMYHMHWACFHPWVDMLRRGAPSRANAAREAAGFAALTQARETVAGTLIAQAKEYSDAGRHRVALSILRDAICIEPQSSFPAARAIKSIYQAGVAAAAAEQRAAFLQGATRKGQWKSEGKVKLVPPPVADEPAVILSKAERAAPYRVQVDVDLEQQPGGGGIVVAAQDAKNYL